MRASTKAAPGDIKELFTCSSSTTGKTKRIVLEKMALDKERIYGYAKAYLEAQTILLKNKFEREDYGGEQ